MKNSLLNVFNMDAVIEIIMAGLIEVAKFPKLLKFLHVIPEYDQWSPGKKLKILLCGYNGARNTGADVRVKAMVDQFYHILGKDNIEISVMTLNKDLIKGYFDENTNVIEFNTMFFKDLLHATFSHHLVVMSEGACFKSKFANALTVFMAGAAGLMDSQKKKAVAYGSEAGEMDWLLRAFVKHYCKNAYIISRTEPSMKEVEKLGLSGELGTDTAWIFEPAGKEWAEQKLKESGWKGEPILGINALNPFIWPVRPYLGRFIAMKLKGQKTRDDHYQKWYFFTTSKEREQKFEYYLSSLSDAVNNFMKKHDVFPVIIGMEKLDIKPCQDLQKRLERPAPVFCSNEYNGYQIMSILWSLKLLISQDYHATALSMIAGVPSCGIALDERIINIMWERGHLDKLCISVEESDLNAKTLNMMEYLWQNEEPVRNEILDIMPSYLKKMSYMGKLLKDYIRTNFPSINLPPDSSDWQDYLPPLSPTLRHILERKIC